MIEQLDQAARPQGEVQVFQLPGGISGQTLQNALKPMGIEASVAPGPRGGRRTPDKAAQAARQQ
jgi:hypothetical protein